MGFNRESFYDFLLDNEVIGFDPRGKNGKYWFARFKNLTGNADKLDELTEYIVSFVKDKGIDVSCFFGVPDLMNSTADIANFKINLGKGNEELNVPMGRRYPTKSEIPETKYFAVAPKGNVVVLEQQVVDGFSLINTCLHIKELRGYDRDVRITKAISIFDSMRKVRKLPLGVINDGDSVLSVLNSIGVRYYCMSNALELLPRAYERLQPGRDVAEAIERDYEQNGIEPIKLRGS